MAAGEDQREQVVADLVVDGARVGASIATPISRASCSCLRSQRAGAAHAGRSRGAWRWPSARRPGCPGRPTRGHFSSAATSASCARSSATPTSRTIRASAAIRRGGLDPPDRLDRALRRRLGRHAEVCVRRLRGELRPPPGRPRGSPTARRSGGPRRKSPSQRHALGPLDGLLAVLGLDDPVAADQLLGLAERAVGDAARPRRRARASRRAGRRARAARPPSSSSSLYAVHRLDVLERRALRRTPRR